MTDAPRNKREWRIYRDGALHCAGLMLAVFCMFWWFVL